MTTRTLEWSAAAVRAHVLAAPNMDWTCEGDDVYAERYIRPVAQFGLSLRFDPALTPRERFDADLMPIKEVPVSAIKSSTQVEGICLDIVEHYLDSTELFDRDGWFGNEIPVLIIRADGTYTVRDGNHRCIAAMLRGDATITAHVID